MREKTLVIIKPDGVRRNIIGDIISRYERESLEVANIKWLNITRELAELHYAEHKNKDFFVELMDYITSGASIIIELTGENAIKRVREINVEIRKQYAIGTTQNTVHGSDSPESAKREIELFFNETLLE